MTTTPKITQAMIKAYDDYTHLTLDRRGFMRRLTALSGSAAAAAAIAPMLAASKAKAAMIAEDDPRVAAERVTYPSANGETMGGYLARPAAGGGPFPAVLVIHENRGLNPHLEDVARRLAVEGFLALAADFLTPAGGTPADEEQARQVFGSLDMPRTIANAVASVEYLRDQPLSNGRVGAVGFCWGGGLANQTAVHAGDALAAGVAYYGPVPAPEDANRIEARMLLHYAGLDDRINAGIPAYETALSAAGVDYQIHVYEGANHAFNNDTSSARYDPAAAELAWSRTVAFFRETLG